MAADVKRVLRLITYQGTLDQARRFLKDRNLPSSATNWKEMVDKRFSPHLKDSKLSLADLVGFLNNVEEHGRQHILLFQSDRVDHLFDKARLRQLLAKSPNLPKLNEATIADMPATPVVSEIRNDRRNAEAAIVIKIVETRARRTQLREEKQKNSVVVHYKLEPYRAVNTIRVSESGLLEMRIFQHDTRFGYTSEAHAAFSILSGLLNEQSFTEVSLDPLKRGLWQKGRRDDFTAVFSRRHSRFRNILGNRMDVAGTIGADLAGDTDLIGGVDSFTRNQNNIQCDSTSVLLKRDGSRGKLQRDIHIIFSGAPHEFTLTEGVDRDEYEYALDTILRLSKVV